MNQGLPPADWDDRLARRGGSILQSRLWGEFQNSLGRSTYWAEDTGWQWLAALRDAGGIKYLFCGYGPVGESEQLHSAVQSLKDAAGRIGADFVRIEPQSGITMEELRQLGAKPISEVDPEHSQILDLTKPEDALRSELASGHRNLINGTERRGITVRVSENTADLDQFLNMLDDTASRAKVKFYPHSYYRKLNEVLGPRGALKLYIAEANGQSVAGAMFYDWGGCRYYAHAGAYQAINRKVNASVSLVWQAIIDAKALGLERFDLWGVAPEGDTKHHLANLSRFKRGFGGEGVNYLGTWDLPVRTVKYGLYGLYRRARGRR